MKIPKSTVYREGQRPACPYCQSIQAKSMANQPKKYPFPRGHIFSDKKEIEMLQYVWNNGYDCKRCGHEFIALPYHVTPLWEQEQNGQADPVPTTASAPVPIVRKSATGGCLSSLVKLAIGLVVIFAVLAYIASSDEKPNKVDDIEQIISQKEQEAINRHAVEMPTPEQLNEDFSPEAEEAAHGDYDPTPVATDRPEPKTYESENLTITESVR